MAISNIIEQLGYSPKQVKLYLAALDMGEGIITDLAERAGVPRTSAQSTIADMYKRGLMDFYLKHKRKYWVAANPDKLLNAHKQKEQAFKNIIPTLIAKRGSQTKKPAAGFYRTQKELELIMDDLLSTKTHIMCVMSFDHWREMFSDEYTADFIRRRNNSFLKMRFLTSRSAAALALQRLDQQQNRQTRFLPPHIDIKNPNFIYGNKVAIMSLSQHSPMGIVMEDEDIANSMRLMFEALWLQSADN